MGTITVGGKERPFKFSLKAIRMYCESQEIKVSDFFANVREHTKNIVDNIEHYVHAGIMAADKECELTIADVKAYIEELTMPELSKLIVDVSKLIVESITAPEIKKENEAQA